MIFSEMVANITDCEN